MIRPIALSVAATVMTVLISASPAHAGQPGSGADCTWQSCKIKVTKPGTPPGKRPGKPGGKGGSGPARPDPWSACITILMQPQPPKSDPIWAGHTTGSIYMRGCQSSVGTPPQIFWAAGPATPPRITPGELAQRALATVRLPRPQPSFSPGQNSDNGTPYTWVNVWTWYWTTPQSWRPLTATAALDGISATITVAPQSLSLTPGDGGTAATCAGPGRAWTAADGNSAPSDGGCGYRYQRAQKLVRPQLTIRWAVSWTASDGSTGTLPAMTTQATSAFMVEQIQSVNR